MSLDLVLTSVERVRLRLKTYLVFEAVPELYVLIIRLIPAHFWRDTFTKAPTIEACIKVLLRVLTACFSKLRPNNRALATNQFE